MSWAQANAEVSHRQNASARGRESHPRFWWSHKARVTSGELKGFQKWPVLSMEYLGNSWMFRRQKSCERVAPKGRLILPNLALLIREWWPARKEKENLNYSTYLFLKIFARFWGYTQQEPERLAQSSVFLGQEDEYLSSYQSKDCEEHAWRIWVNQTEIVTEPWHSLKSD